MLKKLFKIVIGPVRKYKKTRRQRKKFFKELSNNDHLDIRYGKEDISKEEVKDELKRIFDIFIKLSKQHNIKPILMHGGLIGYYFNKKLLPWDDDIDIALLEKDIEHIQKLHGYQLEGILIEVNPNSINRKPSDKHNVIDARVISKRNGVFIDIIFLTAHKSEAVSCKSPHYYSMCDIAPLKAIMFEGVELYAPFNIKKCLVNEYGKNVLLPYFKNWKFESDKWYEQDLL